MLHSRLGSPCRALLPVVVFCFSKKRCDSLSDTLSSLDMTSPAEKSEIHVFCEKSLTRLKGGDRNLPQILRLWQMLKKGIGVHHAGDLNPKSLDEWISNHTLVVLVASCALARRLQTFFLSSKYTFFL